MHLRYRDTIFFRRKNEKQYERDFFFIQLLNVSLIKIKRFELNFSMYFQNSYYIKVFLIFRCQNKKIFDLLIFVIIRKIANTNIKTLALKTFAIIIIIIKTKSKKIKKLTKFWIARFEYKWNFFWKFKTRNRKNIFVRWFVFLVIFANFTIKCKNYLIINCYDFDKRLKNETIVVEWQIQID